MSNDTVSELNLVPRSGKIIGSWAHMSQAFATASSRNPEDLLKWMTERKGCSSIRWRRKTCNRFLLKKLSEDSFAFFWNLEDERDEPFLQKAIWHALESTKGKVEKLEKGLIDAYY